MTLDVDASEVQKRYVAELESAACDRILRSDPSWLTVRHAWVEFVRNLYRLLEGSERSRREKVFEAGWRRMNIVELDRETCERAAELANAHTVARSMHCIWPPRNE